MPSRNILKSDVPQSFYHIYARGANRQRIFKEPADFEKFLRLFQRYLSLEESRNSVGVSFPNFYNRLELVGFSLLPNSFHLLVYQHQPGVMSEFMRSLLTSYSMYFNKKYKRRGPLFESRYRASLLSDDAYLTHVSRYIHLCHRHWQDYEYSSLPYFLQQISDEWIRPNRVTEQFVTPADYLAFLEDKAQYKEMLEILKHELADEAVGNN